MLQHLRTCRWIWLFAGLADIACLKARDNPQDPLNPSYLEPTATISLVNGTVFTSTSLTITWSGPATAQFRYWLTDSLSQPVLAPHDYSSDSLAAHLTFLDDGPYQLTVVGRYNASHTDTVASTANFRVSAVQGPTLKFDRLRIAGTTGQPLAITIRLANVPPVLSGTLQISFPGTLMSLDMPGGSSAVTAQVGPGDGLYQAILPDFSVPSVVNAANLARSCTITTGFLPTTGTSGLKGTHDIVAVHFRPAVTGTAPITITAADFRDPNNNPITIQLAQSAQVTIR